jgi:ABC-type transport system involved in multi-copper enzyme maturation permease subunit
MRSSQGGFGEGARIILAITVKDSLEAVRDRKLLSVFVAVLLMVALFRYLPALREGDTPVLAVVDPGPSALLDRWAESGQFELQRMSSQQEMEYFLGGEETAVLGLVLPPDFDQNANSGAALELDGYVDHWVSDARAEELRSTFETQLTALSGRPVRIDINKGAVFTHPRGLRPVTTSFLMAYALVVVGLMIAPNLMIEEKELRTMDALLTSPASAGQIVTAKALTGLIYCLMGGGLVLAASAPMVVHWDIAILAVISGSLFTVALGLLLGVVLDGRQQLIIWSSVLMFPLFIPVIASEILPDLQAPVLVQQAVSLIPTVWVAEATRWALSAEVPWGEIGLGLAVTVACAILLLAGIAWIVRRSDR